MKDKNKKIKRVAEQIAALELKCQRNKDKKILIDKYMDEMQRLTKNLSLEELLAIDEYIIEKTLLTK